MKYLIVGLGNIGAEYAGTRHNIGFEVADALAADLGAVFAAERLGDVARAKFRGKQLLLLKPSTYMNLSGKAAHFWMQKENIPLEQVFVVVDDLNLPFARLRIRTKGSDGGHNGLKSLNQMVGSKFARLRFGIGNDYPKGQQADFVLGKWSASERDALPPAIELSMRICKEFVIEGATNLMNRYNGADGEA